MWRLRIPAVLVMASWASSCAGELQGEDPLPSFHLGAPAGIRRYRPETWGLVAAWVLNPRDRPADVLATMYFADDPNLQYARRLWVPARAKRYSWCPIFPPRSGSPDTMRYPSVATKVEIKSLLFDRSGPKEVLIRSRSGPMVESAFLPVYDSPAVTGVVYDSGADEESDDVAIETVAAARVSAGFSPVVSLLYQEFLPPVVESLQGLDQLVLASDRVASDAAGLVALRRWLHGGGRLWVMLDRVEPATVELLLGDAFRLHVVDRVGLCRVLIREAGSGNEHRDAQPREFEEPVDLVRVLATGMEVTHTKRLERMAWIGPIAAAATAATLIVMGLRARNTVPPTLAIAQLVEVEPGADDVQMTGLLAMYNQRASEASVGARRGGIFRPDMTGLEGTARRMVRTDLDAWHWERLTLPAGVRTAPFQHGTKISRPIEARAAFGPKGLTGTLASEPFTDLADAIIAAPSRMSLAVELDRPFGGASSMSHRWEAQTSRLGASGDSPDAGGVAAGHSGGDPFAFLALPVHPRPSATSFNGL